MFVSPSPTLSSTYRETEKPITPSQTISFPNLQLDELRSRLIRYEETIIFALIERAQFKLNRVVYEPGGIKTDRPYESFLDFFLRETEKIYSLMRRYTSPDENAFFPDDLLKPIIPLLNFPQVIQPNRINMNTKVKALYLDHVLPLICEEGDDGQYGSCTTCDVSVLQALSKRVHLGKFVAEAKFQEEKEKYTKYILEKDSESLMRLLTNTAVEEKVLKRVRFKTSMYGRDLNEEGDMSGVLSELEKRQAAYKVDPKSIEQLYRDYIIPLTKEVEVEYLLKRLNNISVAFLGPVGSFSHDAALKYFEGQAVDIVPKSSYSEVFSSVLSNQTHYSIIPVENSITGRIPESFNRFFAEASSAKVCGEVYIPVNISVLMIKRDNTLPKFPQVTHIYSHPHVFSQCSRWIKRHCPDAQLVPVSSSARAAQILSDIYSKVPTLNPEEPNDTERALMLGNKNCQHFYEGLQVVEEGVQDMINNITRFFVLSKSFPELPTGRDKTLVIFGLKNHSGSLSSVLNIFQENNINLTMIESFPGDGFSSYTFILELEEHVNSPNVKRSLEQTKEVTTFQNVIGSFPSSSVSLGSLPN